MQKKKTHNFLTLYGRTPSMPFLQDNSGCWSEFDFHMNIDVVYLTGDTFMPDSCGCVNQMADILKNIPAYEMTNEQLSQVSKKWQNEVEAIQQEAQNMYKNYQSDLVFLSAEMKTKREEEIVKKEQEAQDLKRKYFGPEGELYKKRESLMKPIQDEVYNAA